MAVTKCGIDVDAHIIPGEDPEEFRGFADDLTERYRPLDAGERFLVEQLIADGWRLRRLRKTEPQIRARCAGAANSKVLRQLLRLIASVQRAYNQAAADLERLQAARPKTPPNLYYVH